MLSHDNLLYDTYASKEALANSSVSYSVEDRVVSYLPLSHIAALNFDVIS